MASVELSNERRASRFDEELEASIDQRVSYRTGWPALQVLPLWTLPIKDPLMYLPDHERQIQIIRDILEEQRVRTSGIQVAHRLHYETSRPDDGTATLFITAESGTGNWYMAVRDMRRHLAEQDVHISIEILDYRAQSLSMFPILPSHTDTFELWNGGLKDTFIKILGLSRKKWVSINILHVGLEETRDGCPRTILISAADAADEGWWHTVLPRLRKHCSPNLLVELIHQDQVVFDPNEEAVHAAMRLS